MPGPGALVWTRCSSFWFNANGCFGFGERKLGWGKYLFGVDPITHSSAPT